jgi:hypothetical protein
MTGGGGDDEHISWHCCGSDGWKVYVEAGEEKEEESSPETQLENSLVGYWNFDEDSGGVASDVSGNGNDGTIHGAKLVDGKYGKALSFDGKDDYIEISKSHSLAVSESLLTDYTLEFWFKTSCSDCGLFSIVQGSSVPPAPHHDRHIYLNNGNICQRIWNDQTICTSGTNYADNNWHHVTQYVQQEIGQRIYIDGVQETSGTKDKSDFNWAEKFWIGFSSDATSDYFNGIIDEVRIYNYSLTEDEIKTAMHSSDASP